MGQQQLLLLILAAVIVGVAITLGINMFAQNAAQANQDAVVQDILTIASRSQAWFRRPVAMGGGGRLFTGLTLDKISFPVTNANGKYTLTPSPKSLNISATGVEDAGGAAGPLTVTVTGVDSVNVPAPTIVP